MKAFLEQQFDPVFGELKLEKQVRVENYLTTYSQLALYEWTAFFALLTFLISTFLF